MRRFNFIMLGLLLLFGVPFYWFFLNNGGPAEPTQPITIVQLRQLAGANPKARPLRIHYEVVAWDNLMGNRIAAGIGLRRTQLSTIAYQLEFGSGAPILIGSGITRAASARHGQDQFDGKAQARVAAALAGAAALVPLAPGDDQIGGLKMLAGTRRGMALAEDVARQQRLDREGAPYRVAPGVVVIPTPRLMPGSRLVYVRLADGRERLFAGSLAPIEQSWSQLRLPSRFTTDLGVRQDRGAIRSWLLTLRALKHDAPGLRIMPGNQLPPGSGFLRNFPPARPGASSRKVQVALAFRSRLG